MRACSATLRIQSLLPVLASGIWVFVAGENHASRVATVVASLLLCGAWFASRAWPIAAGRWGAAVLVVWAALHGMLASLSPGETLWLLVAAIAVASRLWVDEALRRHDAERARIGSLAPRDAHPTGLAASVVLGLVWIAARRDDPSSIAALATLAAAAAALHPIRQRDHQPRRFHGVQAFGLLGAIAAGLAGWHAGSLGICGVVCAIEAARAAMKGTGPSQPGTPLAAFASFVTERPAYFLLSSFALACVVGTLGLMLPSMTTAPGGLDWITAAFTAVSATCVTGLAVLDTGSDFTGQGQLLLLVLIQVGGLGIMAFSASALLLLGQRMSVRHESTAVALTGSSGRRDLAHSAAWIFGLTAAVEVLVALGLSAEFVRLGEPLPEALWRGIFTSVSAFCNAGFALQADSMMSFAGAPLVLLWVSVAIICGGIGPLVAAEGWAARRSKRRMNLHARIVLGMTLMLLVFGTLAYLATESSGLLASHSPMQRVLHAFFHSASARTAGFNTLDLGDLSGAGWTTTIVLMFIGASPGSTGGGVKTTTVAVATAALAAVLRGDSHATLAGRRFSAALVLKVGALLVLFTLSVLAALLALQLTQSIPLMPLFFEVVSAMATTGLSMGATGELDEVGRLIIIACMFLGRVGPVTLFMVFVSRKPRVATLVRQTEDVPVG